MYPLLVVAAKTSIDKQNKHLLLKVKLVNQNISYKRFLVYHVPPLVYMYMYVSILPSLHVHQVS